MMEIDGIRDRFDLGRRNGWKLTGHDAREEQRRIEAGDGH